MFEFKSKAETLSAPNGKLKKSEIPPFVYFSKQEFLKNKSQVFDRIKNMDCENVIVRSSSLNDQDQYSNAGAFLSIPNAVSDRSSK